MSKVRGVNWKFRLQEKTVPFQSKPFVSFIPHPTDPAENGSRSWVTSHTMHDSCCSSFTQGMIHVLWLYKIQRKEKKWGAEQHRSWKNKEKLDEDMEEELNREGRTTNEERRKNRTSNKGRNPETDTGEPRTSKKKSSTIHEERGDENTDTNGRAWKLRKVVRKQKENPKAPTDEEENHHILQTPASPLISPGKYLLFLFFFCFCNNSIVVERHTRDLIHACLFPTVPSRVTGLGQWPG